MKTNENINLKNGTIVDVRSAEEFYNGNIEGSINIPFHEVWKRMEEFKTLKTPLVLCCASGGRSGIAHDYLLQQGIKSINAGSCNNVF